MKNNDPTFARKIELISWYFFLTTYDSVFNGLLKIIGRLSCLSLCYGYCSWEGGEVIRDWVSYICRQRDQRVTDQTLLVKNRSCMLYGTSFFLWRAWVNQSRYAVVRDCDYLIMQLIFHMNYGKIMIIVAILLVNGNISLTYVRVQSATNGSIRSFFPPCLPGYSSLSYNSVIIQSSHWFANITVSNFHLKEYLECSYRVWIHSAENR